MAPVDLADDAGNVTETIAIAIEKAGSVDLVDGGFFPPGVLDRSGSHNQK